MTELAEQLSATAHRHPPWDHTTIGKFLRNEHATEELMYAFSKFFNLPPQIIVPRSYEEADQLMKESRRWDPVSVERERRATVIDGVAEVLEMRDARDNRAHCGVYDDNGPSEGPSDDAGKAARAPRRERRRPRGVGTRR